MLRAVGQWFHGWYLTYRVWREADRDTWRFLTRKTYNEDDFVEAPRP